MFPVLYSKVQDFIQQISKRHAALTCGYANVLGVFGTLRREPIRGSERAASRIARSVAIASGIALSIGVAPADGGSINATKNVYQLADSQLTEKQEACHNQITFRESSNNPLASNGSHWGYYQGKSKALKHAPDDYQFWWYWSYVSHRYGVTQYDEPNYCRALLHLKIKGWQ